VAWRGVPRRRDANRDTGHCLGSTMLSSMVFSCFISDWWSGKKSRSCCGGG
jgi:hypothetical protein